MQVHEFASDPKGHFLSTQVQHSCFVAGYMNEEWQYRPLVAFCNQVQNKIIYIAEIIPLQTKSQVFSPRCAWIRATCTVLQLGQARLTSNSRNSNNYDDDSCSFGWPGGSAPSRNRQQNMQAIVSSSCCIIIVIVNTMTIIFAPVTPSLSTS